jgi:signal transduction histidine kinase
MKSFHKHLIVLFVFIVAILSPSLYFTYNGISALLRVFSSEKVYLIGLRFQNIVESEMMTMVTPAAEYFSDSTRLEFAAVIQTQTSELQGVSNFYIVNKQGDTLFALFKNSPDTTLSRYLSRSGNDAGIDVFKESTTGDLYITVFSILQSAEIYGIVIVDPKVGVYEILHNLNIKYYLLVFAALLCVFIMALIGVRLARLPTADLEKALTNIDKRKYGYRLRLNKNDDFHELRERLNSALDRMEKLDTAQRSTAQRYNSLLKEKRTVARFMDIMAHEVKNPLHAFVINLDVLRTKIREGRAKADTLKHVKILELEVAHLQEVIQGFVHYVRPGVPRKERTRVNDIIRSACQMAGTEAKKRKIKIETKFGRNLRDVMVDKGHLKQSLHNLLLNAIHASKDNGRITVRSWSNRRRILVAVKDEGSGIRKEQLDKIFDLYYTTKKDGSGLGLPITNRMLEANNARLRIDSQTGKGTTATIDIPAL